MDTLLRIRKAASSVGLHEVTLRRYELKGLITPMRDSSGGRLYTREHLKRIREIALDRANHKKGGV
jgi:DNA-binding transcriptional MerR regulator